jgi:phosphoserine phosphatase
VPSHSFILNVIAGPSAQLQHQDGADLKAAIGKIAETGPLTWLAENRAFDLAFEGNAVEVRAAARSVFQGKAIDVNAMPAANRRKKILVADMDSTIITCECLDELADMAGIKAKVSAITERAMRGELDFAAALRERVALIKGLDLKALEQVYAERVRLNPGARELLATMRKAGAHTMLVSGGFTYFTSRVAKDAGFEANQGNTLLDDGTALTGTVGEPILGRDAKRQALEDLVKTHNLTLTDSLAVGDGANDLDMIQKSGLGVAYHAKPVVAEAAETLPTGATIQHGDLTSLLYLQGYSASEIVNAPAQ